jgi:hypothetical protein
MTAIPPRPRVVNAAFWTTIAGAVLLVIGGLQGLTSAFSAFRAVYPMSASDDAVRQVLLIHRAFGAVCIVVGLGLGYLAGRTRSGDYGLRRALLGLSVAFVLVIFVGVLFMPALFASPVLELPLLISVIPIAVGATLLTRPVASAWFDGVDSQDHPDG